MKMVRRGRRGRAVLKTDVSLEAAAAAAGILNGDDNGDDNDLQQQQQHCASVGGVAYAAALNTQLHENHQHFASPKRKDCKMDKQVAVGTHDDATENAVPNGDLKMKSSVATTPNRKTKAERNSGGGGAGKTIGVPLATRAQTRTIEIFFQAKAEQQSAAAATQTQQTAKLYETKTEQTANANAVINLDSAAEDDNDEEDDASNGASEYSENTNTEQHEPHDFTSVNLNAYRDVSQASSFRSSTSDAENIFLQEPVLSLNVDKSPIHAACCVKINKSLDSEPIFSSPPSSLATSQLNGRFSQIVSLQGSPIVQELNCFDYKTMNGFSNNNNIVQQQPQPQQQQLQPPPQQQQQKLSTPLGQRERKPTTPHRIVVFGTSPIKTKALHDNAGTMTTSPSKRNAMHKELYYQSPRKSQRHTQAQVAVAAAAATTTGTTNKTRRRLNQKGLELYLAANSTTTKTNDVTTTTRDTTTTTTTTTKTNKLHCKIEPEVPTTLLNGHLEAANGPLKLEPHDEDEEFENLELQQQPQAAATIKHELLNEQPQPKLTQNAPKQQQNKALKMKGGHAGGGTQPLSLTNGNREMTEFFPVRRRSERKTKTAVKEEMMRDLEQAVLEERAEGMKVAYFEGKGRGIVADRHFKRGEFVVEYVGDLISIAEAGEREKRYALDENAGCYMYYFKHKTQQYCIDATVDTGKFGRLVNHSRNGNLLTKVVVVKQRPHLVLIAKEDIEPGEELTYDYGDRSKLSLLHHPWLAF